MKIFLCVQRNILKLFFAFMLFFSLFGGVNAELIPTIHSVAEGGNWSSVSTWVEGRVPNENDIVEVNGIVNGNRHSTIKGLVVNGNLTGVYTVIIKGDMLNKGTIDMNINVSGNINNTGIITVNKYVYLSGNGIKKYNFDVGSSLATIILSNNIEFSGYIEGAMYLPNGYIAYGSGSKMGVSSISGNGNKIDSSLGIEEIVLNGDGYIKGYYNAKITKIKGKIKLNRHSFTSGNVIVTKSGEISGIYDFHILGYILNLGTIGANIISEGNIINEGKILINKTLYLSGAGSKQYDFSKGESQASIIPKNDIVYTGNIEGNGFYPNGYLVYGTGSIMTVKSIYGNGSKIESELGIEEIRVGSGGVLKRNYNAKNTKILGKTELQDHTYTTGNVELTNSGSITSNYTFSINGDLWNKGEIGANITSEGNIINEGKILINKSLYLSGTGSKQYDFSKGESQASIIPKNDIIYTGNIEGNTLHTNSYNIGGKKSEMDVYNYNGSSAKNDGNNRITLLTIKNNGSVSGNINADYLIIDNNAKLNASSKLYGSLFINSGGKLENPGSRYGITVYKDIENNGIVNNTNILLGWDAKNNESNYKIRLTNSGELNVGNYPYYHLPDNYINNKSNILWNYKSNITPYSDTSNCINVVGCIKIPVFGETGTGFNKPIKSPYNDKEKSNSYINTSSNYSSKENIHKSTVVDESNKDTEKTAKKEVSSESDKGDPVNLNTGEFVYDNTIMQYAGEGLPFSFDIHYKNQAYYNGPLGNNWDYNYNLFLVEDTDGNINFHNGKLGVTKFQKTGTGFLYNNSINAELKKENTKFVLNIDNKKIITFGENRRVETIADKYGNTMSFEYNTEDQLVFIIDSLGRKYSIDYYDHTRLKSLTDFVGNKVEFIYFNTNNTEGSLYDLKTIRNTFGTEVRDISFTYTKGDTFDKSHNIIKLIDSENHVYVENSYDSNDRVKTQKFGEGTITYNYTLSGSRIAENNVTNRLGNKTTYFYDEAGNTKKKIIHKSTGDVTYKYEYTLENKLKTEIYPDNSGYTYKYDKNGNIEEKRFKKDISVADSNTDIVTKTIYDLKWNIPTQITSANGLITKFTLDDLGNIKKKETLGVKDIEGKAIIIVETFDYNTLGQLIKQVDAGKLVTTFDYLSGSLVKTTKGTGTGAIVTKISYDNKGNIKTLTDGEGNITKMSYDDFNLLTQTVTPEGITSKITYNKLNKKVNERIILAQTGSVNTSYLYDILDNPVKVTTDLNKTRKNILVTKYDADSRVIETQNGSGALSKFEYNETGKITKKTIIDGGKNFITKYDYDDNDRLIKETSANGSITKYSYDKHGKLIQQTHADNTYSKFSYDIIGNVLDNKKYSASGSLLYKETAEYDLLNRAIISNKIILGKTEKTITTKVKYDAIWNITESIDEKNRVTKFIYDEYHRLKETIEPSGNKIIQEYNKNDKVISNKVISPQGKTITTSYIYDKDNRLIKEIDTNGDFEKFVYNNLGQIIEKTDKNKNKIEYSYDYSGNLVQEKQGTRIVSYEYDERGNMTQLTDANKNVTKYKYDGLNRVIKRTYPDGKSITSEYDNIGNINKVTDTNGTVIKNKYDTLGKIRLREIIPTQGVLGVTSETYKYDELGRLIFANDSQNNAIEFEYDSLNRLTKEINSGKEILYSYDEMGNIVELTYPDGRKITRKFDNQDRLKQILSENKELADYTYDSLSLKNKSYANNTKTDYTYDNLLRLKSLNTNSATGSGLTISNYSYDYDKNGNIISDGTEIYTYDIYNRLEKVDYSTTLSETFDFDDMGNRDTVTLNNSGSLSNTFYENNNLNQITNTGTGSNIVTYEYDNNGNLKQDDNYKYFYDYKNRLIRVSNLSDAVVVEYTYDILGRRISKRLGSGENFKYIYANKQKIAEIKTHNGVSLKKEFIYGASLDDILAVYSEEISSGTENQNELGFCSRLVIPNKTAFLKYNHQNIVTRCETLQQNITKTTNLYFYHKKHLGSVIAISDETGKLVENYKYDVYGNIIDFKESLIGNDIYYTGREYDKEIGLYYNRARYYSPKLGRFIARDPIDIADDINLYAYVGNNPVMYVDLMGTEKQITAEQYRIKFVEVYNEYYYLKSRIYNNNGKFDLGFILENEDKQIELLNRYNLSRDQARKMHYNRNKFNVSEGFTIQDAKNNGWRQLSNTKSALHQIGVPENSWNQKWVSKDGKQEAVFHYETEKLILDETNVGTYNFYSPDDVIGHIEYDVLPYKEWGNGLNDKSNIKQRSAWTRQGVIDASN